MTKKDDRIKMIVSQIRGMRVKRIFNLKHQYKPMSERVFSDSLVLLDQEKYTVTIEGNDRKILIGNDGLSIHMEDRFDDTYYHKDYLSKDWEAIVEKLTELLTKDSMGNITYTLEEFLEKPPKIYDDKVVGWEIYKIQNFSKKDKPNKELMMATHIAEILVAYMLDDAWTNSDVKNSLINQFRQFVHHGKVNLEVPEKIDLKNPEFPQGNLFLSDGRKGLVWKFKKYFGCCGKLDKNCYCSPIDIEIKDEERYPDWDCWKCYEKSMIMALTGEYQKGREKEHCKCNLSMFIDMHMDYLRGELPETPDEKEKIEKWVKENGEFFNYKYKKEEYEEKEYYDVQVSLKKLSKEKAKKLIEIVNEANTESGDYDPPDDMCLCPNW